jgi:Ca2+-dependent lipid-binding protein
MFGKSDPCCEIYLNNVKCGATAVIKKTLNPVWEDEEFDVMLPMEGLEEAEVRCEVWDWDLTGRGSFLGEVIFKGAELLGLKGDELGYDLQKKTDGQYKKKKQKTVGGRLTLAASVSDPENVYADIVPLHIVHKPTLQLTVASAKGLKKADTFGLSDPKCLIFLDDVQVGATAVIDNSLKPVWEDEVFDITLPDEGFETCVLKVQVYDWDTTGKGEFLGQVSMYGGQLLGLSGDVTAYELQKQGGDADQAFGNIVAAKKAAGLMKQFVTKQKANREAGGGDNDGGGGEEKAEGNAGGATNTAKSDKKALKEEKKMAKANKFVQGWLSLAGSVRDPENCFADIEPVRIVPKPTLSVTIVSAKGLKKADMFGKSDPCCEIYLNNVKCGATAVIKKTLNPVWEDEEFDVTLPMEGLEEAEVRCEVWDWDLTGRGSFLGEVLFKGAELLGLKGDELGYDLQKKTDGQYKKKKQKTVGGRLTLAASVSDPENLYAGIMVVKAEAKPTLRIHVKSAANLKKADMFGKSDPCCEIYLNDEQMGATAVIKKTLNPVWEDEVFEVTLPIGDVEGCELRIECWDWDVTGRGGFLGQVVFTGSELLGASGGDSAHELCKKEGKKKQKTVGGQLMLAMDIHGVGDATD